MSEPLRQRVRRDYPGSLRRFVLTFGCSIIAVIGGFILRGVGG